MNVCVFCGSGTGTNPVYTEEATALGNLFGKSSINLIYGGGNIGLMGIIADAVMHSGGEVIGVIPDFLLQREVGHRGITRLEVVDTMHQRKKRMADLTDAFVALPGGWGTLDELAEILTWKQLGLINQPVLMLNTNHYFDHLLSQMKLMVADGFLKEAYMDYLTVVDTPAEVITTLSRKVG